MTIEANIIKDSVGPNGARITTFVLRYPRFIHAEFMTHRMFSRNASSSRAIPFKKQVKMIKEDLAMPERWGLNQSGMQAYTTATGIKKTLGRLVWKAASRAAIFFASILNKLGFHKQIVNRIIEPFSHITVVCTSTDYNNFFGLRYHHAAQPEIYALAKLMFREYFLSKPQKLKNKEWHLPFVTKTEIQEGRFFTTYEQEFVDTSNMTDVEYLIKLSVARCARVSYNNHDGTNTTSKKDIDLYDRLVGSQPIHASCTEHQAMATDRPSDSRSGNFTGFAQYRKTLKGEYMKEFYPNKLRD